MAKDSCVSCGKDVYRGPSSKPEITCHDCRRSRLGRTCRRCGSGFDAAYSTQVREFCGIGCASAANLEIGRAAKLVPNPLPVVECGFCAKVFPGKMVAQSNGRRQLAKYCSFDCYSGFKKASAKPRPRPCAKVCAVSFRQCSICTRWFRRRGSSQTLCGDDCRKADRREKDAAYRAAHRKPPRPSFIGTCVCGDTFTTKQPDRKWCSRCSNDHGRHRKRARKHGVEYEPINPMEIYERDQWVCHICTEPIRKVSGSHIDIDGWSLDHVIPMVHGGPHLKWNVAASHWMCNTFKGDQFFAEAA